ncbi:MAG TPA: proteasome subunit alpha, partial [Pseudonocardia sp.]
EVAVLDRSRPRRAFRRLTGAALAALLPEENREKPAESDEKAAAGEQANGEGAGSNGASAES